jgi:hypothetical protein
MQKKKKSKKPSAPPRLPRKKHHHLGFGPAPLHPSTLEAAILVVAHVSEGDGQGGVTAVAGGIWPWCRNPIHPTLTQAPSVLAASTVRSTASCRRRRYRPSPASPSRLQGPPPAATSYALPCREFSPSSAALRCSERRTTSPSPAWFASLLLPPFHRAVDPVESRRC